MVQTVRRPPFASGDWFKGTDEDYKQEASTYIAYTGPFHVDEERQTLTHTMFISQFPNWVGQTQPRVVKIEGNTLHLSTAAPIKSGGKVVNSYRVWERAKPQRRPLSWSLSSPSESSRPQPECAATAM